MRATIKTVLRAVDRFIVTEAEDGDIALAEIERTNPDVVLCDIAMPRMRGLRLVNTLRNHHETRMGETRVMILTGHAEEATVVAAVRLLMGPHSAEIGAIVLLFLPLGDFDRMLAPGGNHAVVNL